MRLLCSLIIFIALTQTAFAQALEWPMPPPEKSRAYEAFKRRPISEESKLIYLIDRFKHTGIELTYNSINLNARLASRFARLFLMRFYAGETVDEWLAKWCYRAIPSGEVIRCRFPDGRREISKIVLEREVKLLNQLLEKNAAT